MTGGPHSELSSVQSFESLASQIRTPGMRVGEYISGGKSIQVLYTADRPTTQYGTPSFDSQVNLSTLADYNKAAEKVGQPTYNRIIVRTLFAEYTIVYDGNEDIWRVNGIGYENQVINPSCVYGLRVGGSMDIRIPFSKANQKPEYSNWDSQGEEYQLNSTDVQSITLLPENITTIPNSLHIPDIVQLPYLSQEFTSDWERVEEFMAAVLYLQSQVNKVGSHIAMSDDGRMTLIKLAKEYGIEVIGSGHESLAFVSPAPLHGKAAVVTLFWHSQSEMRLDRIDKGHKLLHLIFPENFPDVESISGRRTINQESVYFSGTIRERVFSKTAASHHYNEGQLFAHDNVMARSTTKWQSKSRETIQGLSFPFSEAVRNIIRFNLPIDRNSLADVNPNNYSLDPAVGAERFLDLVDLDGWFGEWKRNGWPEPPKPSPSNIQEVEAYMRKHGRTEADIGEVKRMLSEEIKIQ